MLLPPLKRRDGYPVEFHFVLAIKPIIFLFESHSEAGLVLKEAAYKNIPPHLEAENSLVLLTIENSWASGIIVNSLGCILHDCNTTFLRGNL
jgi:hypothetical protein